MAGLRAIGGHTRLLSSPGLAVTHAASRTQYVEDAPGVYTVQQGASAFYVFMFQGDILAHETAFSWEHSRSSHQDWWNWQAKGAGGGDADPIAKRRRVTHDMLEEISLTAAGIVALRGKAPVTLFTVEGFCPEKGCRFRVHIKRMSDLMVNFQVLSGHTCEARTSVPKESTIHKAPVVVRAVGSDHRMYCLQAVTPSTSTTCTALRVHKKYPRNEWGTTGRQIILCLLCVFAFP